MEERDVAIQIEGLRKRYRLGVIGGGTLQGDIQSWIAKKRGKEDPNSKIGSKTYGKNETFYALDGIDLTVYKGERLGIIGHNGAGKSTLLKLLSRVTAPTEGRICIDGRISSMLEVGTGFNGELTGRENIYMNGAILGMSKAEVDSKIEEIIDFSECRQFIDTPVKRYSSGMYVKLAFAVAAHLDNEIMIMDEVLAVGDMTFQQKCLAKMSDVSRREGKTILYVSHNMDTIRKLCDRCLVLEKGKIAYRGEVDNAVSVYLEGKHNRTVSIDASTARRPYDFMGQKVRVTQMGFSKTESNLFHQQNEILLSIEFVANETLKTCRIRLEVEYFDRTTIGLFESSSFDITRVGRSCVELAFCPHMLPKGKYYLHVDVYCLNDDMEHATVDHPEVSLPLEIMDDDKDCIVWNHNYMGHVRLGRVRLHEIEGMILE